MQPTGKATSTCANCGSVLEETPGGGLGCMSCLLQAGIASGEEGAQDSTPDALGGGMRFGVYEIDCHADGSLCELGRGAMGVTYRGTDTSLQRKVALKIIKTDIAERSADARERFMREARVAAALRHEHIATVYQFGMRFETGQYFYAMELIEGETLDERVRRAGPVDARTTIKIAQQVTSALAAAEKHGLVHRDLKPANLMLVSTDGETADVTNNKKLLVKIIDFGLAKAIHTQTDPKSLTHDRFVGTPAFASPEQFEHSALDVRSDIYSLGETLWFALTGKTPFGGRGVEEIHRAQQSNVLPVEQLKAAHVPHRLKSLVESMLAFEPASRPGTGELAARLQRCSPEARRVRRTRAAFATAAVVVLGMSALFVFQRLWIENAPLNSAPDKSIAVLPFENLSADPNNVYFADGVQDEILTGLSRVADLKVISRTSVLQYKSGVARNLREIAQQLGVANVVEGSVQRSGNRVRVNAQLIDARNDAHLWAQTYDRDLADVFAIQSEIAMAIADELYAKLSSNEKSEMKRPPTNDIIAFDLYTSARDLLETKTGLASSPNDFLLQAIDLLDQATERDPTFFDAYCELAKAHDRVYLLNIDHTPARLALAETALDAASRLRPDTGKIHLARAQNLYNGYLNYQGALAELEIARQTLANDPELFALKGYIARRQRRWAEAVENLQRAIDLDPRNIDLMGQLALSYSNLRMYAEQKRVHHRVLAIAPNYAYGKIMLANVEFDSKANTRPLHELIDRMQTTDPATLKKIVDVWFVCALGERDPLAVDNVLVAAGDKPLGFFGVMLNHSVIEGLRARLMNNEEKARSAFTAARAEQEEVVQHQPNYGPALCALGLIDAGLGDKEKALREGWRAVELLPVEKDSILGAQMKVFLAIIAAWVGEKELACEQLAVALRYHTPLSYGQLKLLPFWDALHGEPCFEELVEEAKKPIALK